jgi:hypothetical protein
MGIAAMSNMRKHPLEVCFVNGARAWENAHNSKIVDLLLGKTKDVKPQLCEICSNKSLFIFSM